ncbi:MAG: DUF3866 family protein [Bifidobacteriaceae bacterium]|nr:DUF3866 family protein [Bifidobacteriaceae bacterium]
MLSPLAAGDWVWLNLRALDLELGTGGVAFVVAPAPPADAVPRVPLRASHPPPADAVPSVPLAASHPPPADAVPRASLPAAAAAALAGDRSASGGGKTARADSGYLVKARYTPLQVVKRGVDAPLSPHHAVLQAAESLEGMPVVVADLHSSLPAVCAALAHDADQAGAARPRVAYIMTDGAALPLAFSRTVARLVANGDLSATITAGQAYGGDHEAVSAHSALLTARHVVGADLAICVQGPGNLGTDTRWGFSGVAVGDAVNAIATLGGRPVGCLRVSGADPRPRHRGLSHHSLTAFGQVALLAADLAVPVLTGPLSELGAEIAAAAQPLADRHRLRFVGVDGLDEVLAATPGLSTMGRDYLADPAAFLAAAAAGRLAWELLTS